MKVLHVSTYDRRGGAAKAAIRTLAACNKAGVDAAMRVKRKDGDSPAVSPSPSWWSRACGHVSHALDSLPMKIGYRRRIGNISTEWFSALSAAELNRDAAEIIHLHWVLDGFLSVEAIGGLRKPVVWTLHDLWPLTGGCHFSYGCEKWKTGCGACPHLCSHAENDLTRKNWRRREKAWQALNLTFIAPSAWVADCVRQHPFLHRCRVETILHGIDLNRFRPLDQNTARHALGLPVDKPLILFGAANLGDFGKGGGLLTDSLREVATLCPGAEIVTFGHGAAHMDIPQKMTALGFLAEEEQLALAYAAADVFVATGTMETGPMTVMEAAGCATASVGVRLGGLPDRIEHGTTGYLARPEDAADLAKGIVTVLDHPREFGLCARSKAEQSFSLKEHGRRHRELYESLLAKGGSA